MKLNGYKLCIKIIEIDMIYNFIVDNFFIYNYLESQFFFNFSELKFNFRIFEWYQNVNMIYTKIIVLNVIYNFVLDNFLIW